MAKDNTLLFTLLVISGGAYLYFKNSKGNVNFPFTPTPGIDTPLTPISPDRQCKTIYEIFIQSYPAWNPVHLSSGFLDVQAAQQYQGERNRTFLTQNPACGNYLASLNTAFPS